MAPLNTYETARPQTITAFANVMILVRQMQSQDTTVRFVIRLSTKYQ